MALCRLQDVHMRYGSESVLCGVDLSIERGTILGLVGENGSGKSTLLKILAGILRPDRGALVASHRRPRIGYMPESSQWYPYLTGAQVLRYFARYTNAPQPAQDKILERVGLQAARDKKVSAYSKGMRQKLGLAQAILGPADLLILDEPTNGLDPPSIINFYEILKERAACGVAIVLSSHLLAEIEGRTTHVAFLRDGRITASGSCSDLVERAGLPSRVLLRQAAHPGRLRATLEEHGWQAATCDDGVEITLERGQVSFLLASIDVSLEADLDVEVRHPSLDDLYLHTLVGDRSRVTSTPGNPAGRNGQLEPPRKEAR